MDSFTVEIAGLVACIQPLFFSTREYFRSFLTDRDPEYYIEVSRQDLIYEQEMAEIEAVEEGLRVRKFTDPFLERATIQRKIACELVNRNTILFHGSTVGLDGAAYLFAAPCGTGKSTHTRFWREIFGSRALMVNDDKPFLQISASGVIAHGSPWCGKHGLGSNISLPLKGICFLERGSHNTIYRVQPEDCLDDLKHYCFIPEHFKGQTDAHSLVSKLSNMVPLWRMECRKDPESALVSYHAMIGI